MERKGSCKFLCKENQSVFNEKLIHLKKINYIYFFINYMNIIFAFGLCLGSPID